jgi:integrase
VNARPTLPIETARKKHRQSTQAKGRGNVSWVFGDTMGGPLLRRSCLHAQTLKPLLEVAGSPAVRFHDLRHTSATLLLSAGAHPKVVQERLSHSRISATMDTYSHVLQGMQQEAAAKFDEMLAGKTG